MKRVILSTTSLVFAGGMAAADVTISGSAEMGVKGSKSADAQFHRDIQVKFELAGTTDTGLVFGAEANLHEAEASRYEKAAIHLEGAFGKLTLGNTDGAFDHVLDEVGSGGAIADDHTTHPGYNGNAGLDSIVNEPNILRYEYMLGGITTAVSGEFGADDASNSTLGIGLNWAADLGGVGMKIGLGYQTGSLTLPAVAASPHTDYAHAVDAEPGIKQDASIIGMSIKVDMGNGLSLTANGSSKDVETEVAGGADSTETTSHTGIGVAYTVGDMTIGVNGGTSSTSGTSPSDASGAGFAVVYSLGTGVDFKIGAGSGETDGAKSSSWSAGLAFSF